MGHFYFTRHGQTVWNVANKICGETDIELTIMCGKPTPSGVGWIAA